MPGREPAVGSNPASAPKAVANPSKAPAAPPPTTPKAVATAALTSDAAAFIKRQAQRRNDRLNNVETELANINDRLEKLFIVSKVANLDAAVANQRRRRRGSGSDASMPTLATGGTLATEDERKLDSIEEEIVFWKKEKERVEKLRDRLKNKTVASATSKLLDAATASTETDSTTTASGDAKEKPQRQQSLPSVGEEVDGQEEDGPARSQPAPGGSSGLQRRDILATQQALRQQQRRIADSSSSSSSSGEKPPVSKIDYSDVSVRTFDTSLTPGSEFAGMMKSRNEEAEEEDEYTGPEPKRILQNPSLDYMCHLLRKDEVQHFPADIPVPASFLSPETVANGGLLKISRAFLRGRDGIVRSLETLNLSGCGIDNDGIKLLLLELRHTLHHNHRSFRHSRLRLVDLSNNPAITSHAGQDLLDILHLIASITEFLVDNQDDQTINLIKSAVEARKKIEEERAERQKLKAIKMLQEADAEKEGVARKPSRRRMQSKILRKHPDADIFFIRKFGLDLSLLWLEKQVGAAASAPITILNLSGQLIGDVGVEILVTVLHSCGGGKHLTKLSLDGNKITSNGAMLLAKYLSGTRPQVQASVDMETKEAEYDPLTETDRNAPALTFLQLEWNRIGEEGAAELSHLIRKNTNIAELLLGRNNLGDTGTIAIADAIWKTRKAGEHLNLIELSLIGNDIGFLGVSRIADCMGPIISEEQAASPSSIQRLRLGDNPKIGTEAHGVGLERLISSVEASTNDNNDALTYLSLWRCSVPVDAEKKLRGLVDARAASPDKAPLTIFLDVHDAGSGKKGASEQSGANDVTIASDDEPMGVIGKKDSSRKAVKLIWDDLAWLRGEYEGEVGSDGIPHGRGTFVTEKGEKKYEGQWVNGARTGWGRGTWASGAEYYGYWLDGLRNGRGFNRFEDDKVYDGEFKNGDRHGYGRQENRDGTIYEGFWQNNYRHGPGMHRSATGAVLFTGEYNCNTAVKSHSSGRGGGRSGTSVTTRTLSKASSGRSSQSDDSRPSSGMELHDDDFEGFRSVGGETEYDAENVSYSNVTNVEEMTCIDACWGFGTYSGSVNVDNKPHGSGEFRSEEGQTYTGDFVAGERTGYGVAKWESGATYEGHWKLGRRHGFGTNVKNNKAQYVGMWRRNERHGDGEEISRDGSSRSGEWMYDNFVKEKKEKRGADSASRARGSKPATTKMAVADFHPIVMYTDNMWGNGMFAGAIDPVTRIPDGEGEFDQSDGRWYDGEWKNGRRHGYGLAGWPMNSMEYDGQWVGGKRHGFGTATFSNGSRYRGEWRDNQRDGTGVFIGPEGQFWKGQWRKDEMMLQEE